MNWTNEDVHQVVINQRNFFRTGTTLNVKWRIQQLKKLKTAILENSKLLEEAMYKDLGRTPLEAYLCDIGDVVYEISETIHGLKRWAKPETHFSGIVAFPSLITKVYKKPYGTCLIISPFNFPVLLSLGVLAAAIAGGNTAVIKASSKSIETTKAIQKIISETYSKDYVTVIDGGHDVADFCLSERFDKIFYTGSPNVAKHVMSEASKNLTPVALELGGETGNWAIVRSDANIKDAARKIAFFKIFNAGQVCININQVAIAKDIAPLFLEELKKEFIRQIGEDPIHSEEYSKLVGLRAFESCSSEVEKYKDRVVFGGVGDSNTLKYSPTIIYPVNIDEEIVNHELFCPILPIVEFDDKNIDKLIETIEDREHGLALYLFTKNKKWSKKIMSTCQFGGGCVNEVTYHMLVKGVPFNGVGHSGMGAYHGEWGFKEFTHPSSVLYGKTRFNLSIREHPYLGKKGNRKAKILKMLLK